MTDHACPDAAILAAFAEGALPPEQRSEVERHVASCPECPAVIGEVTRFLADEAEGDAQPPPAQHRWWTIAAAVAALCIPAVLLWRTASHPDRTARLRSIAAQSQERHYEGRLHGFPHTPFRSARDVGRSPVPIALRAETERLVERGDAEDVLYARGVAALLIHDPDEAVRFLRAATVSNPTDAAIWNDLAVAELARASLGNSTAPTAALQAAHRAIELSPTSAEAHYNLALALEHLGRDTEATAAYRQALAHETAEDWRIEIREHLRRGNNSN